MIFDGKPWELRKTSPDDQPPEHYHATPWLVIGPRPQWGVPRPVERFATFEAALDYLRGRLAVHRHQREDAHA